jgi:single-strand DNA-binding protein
VPGTTTNSPAHRNEVLLVGELTGPPEERTLADGREVVTLRLDVRPAEDGGGGRDSFDCSIDAARARRAALGWMVGDVVEVEGAVRRRFYRSAHGLRPFTVIDVSRARRLGGTTRPRKRG